MEKEKQDQLLASHKMRSQLYHEHKEDRVDLKDRTGLVIQQKEEKLKIMRIDNIKNKEREEIKDCTFKPKTNNYDLDDKIKLSDLTAQQKISKKKRFISENNYIAELAKEETFKPQICVKSRKLVQNQKGQTTDRLYTDALKKEQRLEQLRIDLEEEQRKKLKSEVEKAPRIVKDKDESNDSPNYGEHAKLLKRIANDKYEPSLGLGLGLTSSKKSSTPSRYNSIKKNQDNKQGSDRINKVPRKKNKVKKENKDTVKIPEKIENIN